MDLVQGAGPYITTSSLHLHKNSLSSCDPTWTTATVPGPLRLGPRHSYLITPGYILNCDECLCSKNWELSLLRQTNFPIVSHLKLNPSFISPWALRRWRESSLGQSTCSVSRQMSLSPLHGGWPVWLVWPVSPGHGAMVTSPPHSSPGHMGSFAVASADLCMGTWDSFTTI